MRDAEGPEQPIEEAPVADIPVGEPHDGCPARADARLAQALVGECYLEGIGVEQDIASAETWLYRAARLGNKRAKALLESR